MHADQRIDRPRIADKRLEAGRDETGAHQGEHQRSCKPSAPLGQREQGSAQAQQRQHRWTPQLRDRQHDPRHAGGAKQRHRVVKPDVQHHERVFCHDVLQDS
jgi:hypothetical protein